MPTPARIPRVTGGAVVVIGLGAVLGWQFDISWLRGFMPGRAPMSPMTALALVLLGIALWLSSPRASAWPGRWVPRACAALAALIGLVRVGGYVFGVDLGIDRLLFAQRVATIDPSARMAPYTALTFLLIGVALLLPRAAARRAQLAVQLLALASLLGALVSVTGHAYGTRLLSGIMTLNTALAFLLVATGVLWSAPDRGVAALFGSPTAGGVLVRRLVPAIVLIPLLLGWLQLAGQRTGLYDTAGGTALLVVSTVVVLGAFAAWSIRSLDRVDVGRRAAEGALRDSENRLFQILDAMPIAVFVLDAAGRPHFANQASRDILGKGIVSDASPGQLSETYQVFVAGTTDPYPAERLPVARALRGERTYVTDIEIHRPDRVVPIEVWGAPVHDAAGRLVFAVAVFSDITERQRVQHALRTREERLRLLVGSVRDYAIYMLDPDGRVASWNAGAQQIKGYTAEEIVGRHFSCFYPPEAVAAGAPEANLHAARETGRFEEEGWRIRKDGSRFWADDVISAVGDDRGMLTGFAKVTRDLTERRRVEEALRTSEERFRTLALTAQDAIISADSPGRITYFNPAAERIFGYAAAEVNGEPLTVLMPEQFRAAHCAGLARYLKTGQAHVVGHTVELMGRRKDGREFPIELSLASWKRGGDVAFTGIIRDITERKQIDVALRERTTQLEAANQELEAFSYSVSHDLRAPLRSLDGFSQALLEDCSDRLDAQGKEYLQRVRTASQRMAKLIDDLLDLSRVTRSEMRVESVDLSALARGIAAELQRREPARTMEFEIAPKLVARGDEGLLRVVLENLLGNAWKFTGKRPRARIELGVTQHDGRPAYFVRDDGAGFEMTYAGKLFGAFQRLHGATEFEGTGIGLATVQRIIHRHGGRVWADAAPDRGATFYFTLSRP